MGYDNGRTPAPTSTRAASSFLVGSMILAVTSCRNIWSPPGRDIQAQLQVGIPDSVQQPAHPSANDLQRSRLGLGWRPERQLVLTGRDPLNRRSLQQASTSTSEWADPRCSISLQAQPVLPHDPNGRRPDEVRTVPTYGTETTLTKARLVRKS